MTNRNALDGKRRAGYSQVALSQRYNDTARFDDRKVSAATLRCGALLYKAISSRSVIVLVICLGFLRCFAGNPFDGLKFMLGFRTSQTNITVNSVGDALRCSGTESVSASLSGGANETNKVQQVPVSCVTPMYPWQTNDVYALYVPQHSYYSESGGGTVCYVNPVALDFSGAAVQTTTQTAYIRFNWGGPIDTNSTYTGWMLLNGYNWSATGSDGTSGVGWGVGISFKKGSDPYLGRFCYMIPQQSGVINWDDNLNGIEPNKWYDLFVEISPSPTDAAKSRMVLTVVKEPDHLMVDGVLNWRTPTMRTIIPSATMKRLSFSDSYRKLRIGAETTSGSYQDVSYNWGGYAKGFRGKISRLMMWNRILDNEEKWQVMSGSYGSTWNLGVENGSADEFAYADATDAVWTPTNSWSVVHRELTEAKPTLTIKDVIPTQEIGMEKILAIKPLLSGGQSFPVAVAVNGVSLGVYDLAFKVNRAISIPSNMWKNGLDGTVTITLTRVAPYVGTLAFDSINLCGGWCLGGTMSREGYIRPQYYVGQSDPLTIQRATSVDLTYNLPYVSIINYVPEEAVPVFGYSLSVGVRGNNDDSQSHVFWVNGHPFASFDAAPVGATLTAKVPSSLLKPGENEFVISNSTPRTASIKWATYTHYRIDVKRLKGFVIIFR